MIDPANREIGTDSLAKIYKTMTPGQDCVSENKKVKIVRKKLAQEDNNVPRGGLPIGNGLGQELNVSKAPGFYMGFANVGNSVYEAAQSIQEWALNPKTQQKFADKYGNLAEEKLIEAALKLEACGCGNMPSESKKSLKKIKEMAFAAASSGKGPEDKLGTVPVQAEGVMSKAQIKKRNEIADAIKRENPGISNDKKFRIATAQAMKEESQELNERGADSKGYYRSTESGAGLTRKGAKHFGIKTAVTTPPSKLKKGSKAAKRRKSFCARMGGMPGPMKDEKGRPTRKAMSLRRWNCEE
jgi:hypothetical protein